MDNEKSEHESIVKGKEIGKKAYDEAKVATDQAINALKTLISDPIGGQFEALKNLGNSNALRAGIVLVVVFSVTCFLLGHTFASGLIEMAEMMGGSGGKIAELYFGLFILSVTPSISIFACFYLIKNMSKEKVEISTCVFTTGITTIPLTILFLSGKLFGLNSFILGTVIGIFCISTTFLLINSALQDVYKLSTQKSVLVTPGLVLASSFISYIMVKTFML
tara:strand:- start:156 stop:818 length:663 start_codon:yes stop_codon:yes gene_type:complete